VFVPTEKKTMRCIYCGRKRDLFHECNEEISHSFGMSLPLKKKLKRFGVCSNGEKK
jgi:hypothetical protein